MRVLLVGGIYGKSASYRSMVGPTPETALELGLRARGHEVTVQSHHGPFRRDGADIVHVHHLSYGAVAAVDSARPFVFTAHLFREMTALRRAALRFVVTSADASVVLSESERQWQLRVAPGNTPRPVIPNGVDPRVFRFRPPVPRQQTLRLLYVGQLIPLKGLDYLFHALATVSREVDVSLRLVYQVDDEERRLRQLATDLGLDVDFLGARRLEQLAELYAECHALVLPSTTEALPSVVTEAIFVGRPVIATDVGGVAGQVGDFGRVVPARSVPALADAICELVADLDALAARAARASASAVARHSLEAMAEAHERLYQRLVETRRATRLTPGRIAIATLARGAGRARASGSRDGR